MFSLFQIDFAASEFFKSLCGGLILVLACRRSGRGISRSVRRFAELPVIPAVVVTVLMFLVQVGVAGRYGWPVPAVHDEFSHLLAADTFASGRATNPTHPGWEFFETYHVLSKPSYQSKYPPGSGLVLALGQVLTGQPIVGIWICLAAATGGLFWMLRGWLPSRWALLGAVILICNWPVTKLSGQTYFGGAPALFGAVLVYGAFPRLLRRPSLPASLCLGIGLVMWGVTRPYEGLIASLVPVAILVWRGSRSCLAEVAEVVRLRTGGGDRARSLTTPATSVLPETRLWLWRVAVPLLCVLGSGGAALGWYHWQVTGGPWTWPQRLYDQTYTQRVGPLSTVFAWTELGQRQRTIPSHETQSSAAQTRIAETKPVLYAFWKLVRQWWFHVGLLWTPPLCVAVLSIIRNPLPKTGLSRRPLTLSVLVITLVGVAILLQRSSGMPHYAAPVQPLVILLILQGLRHLWVIKLEERHWGKCLVAWLAASSVLFFVLPLWTGANHPNVRSWSLDRDRIQHELEHRPRPSLVIVKYGPQHSMHEEWVYNRADIDHARVVWARQLEAARMPQLLRLFPDREVWLLKPDEKPVVLQPFR